MLKRKTVLPLITCVGLFSISVPVCFADENEELFRAAVNAAQLIETGKFSEAKIATEKMKIEYAGLETLPEFLYWTAEKYKRKDKFEDAKRTYQKIMQIFPYSTWAKRAKLGIPRAEVIALVDSKDFNQAEEALDKMVSDFAGHPDLPETLYLVAERYKAAERPEDAN